MWTENCLLNSISQKIINSQIGTQEPRVNEFGGSVQEKSHVTSLYKSKNLLKMVKLNFFAKLQFPYRCYYSS